MERRGRLQPRCARNFTATPSGPDGPACPSRGGSCPQLVLAPSADVACNGGVRVLLGFITKKMGNSDLAISLAARGARARKWNNGNGGRPLAKSAGHVPQSCPQEQDAAYDLPGERREASRCGHLVRYLLRPATTRRAFSARLQTRHLDHHAGSPDPPVRRRGGSARRGKGLIGATP